MNWLIEMIGLPWEAGGRGPKSYDCWGLLRKIYADQLGVDLPSFSGVSPDSLRGTKLLEKKDGWERLESPRDFSAVALSTRSKIHHVGVWIKEEGGLIIHCHKNSGLIVQSPSEMAATGWKRIEYYGLNN